MIRKCKTRQIKGCFRCNWKWGFKQADNNIFFWIWIEGIQIKRNKWTRYWEMNIIRLLSTLEHIESRVADIHLQCSLLLFLRMKLKFKKLKATKKNWWKVRQTHTRTHTHQKKNSFVFLWRILHLRTTKSQ